MGTLSQIGKEIGFLSGTNTPRSTTCFDQGVILAHTSGELFALDAATGRKLRHNELSGFGYGHVTMASPTMMASPQLQSVIAQLRSEDEAAAASAASSSAG